MVVGDIGALGLLKGEAKAGDSYYDDLLVVGHAVAHPDAEIGHGKTRDPLRNSAQEVLQPPLPAQGFLPRQSF